MGIIEILENVTIIYDDWKRELFDAIYINDRRVITGRILKIIKPRSYIAYGCNTCHDTFVDSGVIPINNIKSIEGGTKKKLLKKL